MRIASKLNLVAMLLVSTAILAVAFAAFLSAANSLKLARLEQLESIAGLKVEKIQTFIAEKKADLQVVQGYFNIKKNLPILSQYRKESAHPDYLSAKAMLDAQLNVFHRTYNALELMLLNKTGELVYVANPARAPKDMNKLPFGHGHQFFEAEKKGLSVSKIFKEDGGFSFFISAPAYDSQKGFIGVIVFGIDLSSNFRFVQDSTGLGETGETLIGLASQRDLIFLNPRRHASNTGLNQSSFDLKKSAYPMRQAVQGREGHGTSIDYRGKEVLAVWKFIPELNMGLVAKIDAEETYAAITQLKRIILLIAALALFTTFFLSTWLSRTLSRPIIALSEFSKKVASGNLKHRLRIKSKDEIGELAAELNEMTEALFNAQETELARHLKHAKDQQQRLSLQAASLKKTNEELEQFTYVVSHDLQAPFRAIQNYVDFLTKDLQGRLEEEQEMYLAGLGEAVRDGEQFLEDLLSLSRLGKKQGTYISVPIRDFLKELIASLHFAPENEFVLAEGGPQIQLEPTLARQVFQNLISNGLKFNQSPKKQIKIAWKCIDSGHYEISLQDNGIGINPRFFEKIFLPFQQLHPSEVYGGSGIGLATVKKAAAILNWSIRIDSEIGQGSTFLIKIPIS